MFPTAFRLATCPNQFGCTCDICFRIHCPDCNANFNTKDIFDIHLRRPCGDRHACAYCPMMFIRREALITHYESKVCRTSRSSERTPLLGAHVPSRALATKQSFNPHTQHYKCYLCNPVKLGFRTVPALNAHLGTSVHQASGYKCPHTACGRLFNSIGGLLQHIETRSCRCMTDANWWNTYFAPTSTQGGTLPSTQIGTPAAQQALEEYWLLRYAEVTGTDGAWEYTHRTDPDDCGGVLVLIFVVVILIYVLH